MKILVINGPNINMLGVREPQHYGRQTYAALQDLLQSSAQRHGIAVDEFQSNIEGELVGKIQEALCVYDSLVVNPAAYTYTSLALLDALKAAGLPAIEVHISHIAVREDFRRTSVTAAGCIGQIAGLGLYGYALAIDALVRRARGEG